MGHSIGLDQSLSTVAEWLQLLVLLAVLLISNTASGNVCDLKPLGHDNIIRLTFSEASTQDLSLHPALSAYTQPLGLEGSLDDVILTLSSIDDVQSVHPGDIMKLFTLTDTPSGVSLRLNRDLVREGTANGRQPTIEEFHFVIRCEPKESKGQVPEKLYLLMVSLTGLKTPQLRSQLKVIESDRNKHVRRARALPDGSLSFTSSIYEVSVSEGVLADSVITQVSVNCDEAAKVEYALAQGNVNNTFSIDKSSGIVKNVKSLDREALDHISILLSAVDKAAGLTATATLSLTVTDINDNSPVFSPTTGEWVVEEGRSNVYVGTVSATDADTGLNGQVRYTLGSYTGYFSIDAVTGEIRVIKPLNYDQLPYVDLLVVASDSATDARSTSMSVRVTVSSADVVIPVFYQQLYQINVPENSVNYVVTAVRATSRSPSATIQYQIVAGEESLFKINETSGEVRTQAPLDYERVRYHILIISTRQSTENNPQYSCTVNITVLDLNDNRPRFSEDQYSAQETTEDALPGTVLAAVSALDDDGPGPNSWIRFSISKVDPSSGTDNFFIFPDTGMLIISRQLTQDTSGVTQYVLTVVASDLGDPALNSSSTVNVLVVRNLYPPNFDNSYYTVSIEATQPVDSLIQTMKAVDNDDKAPYNVVQYEITGDSKAQNFYSIDGGSGQVTLTSNLADDADLNYNIRVKATDGGGRSTEAVLVVSVNRNLHAPHFTQQAYTANVQENQALLRSIVKVKATDEDVQAPFNTVQYSVVGDTVGQQYFTVDKDSGVVSLIQSVGLDPLFTVQYKVIISCEDGGLPTGLASTNRATVSVNVLRNLYAPVFYSHSNTVDLSQDFKPGARVLTVNATDNDTVAAFSTVTYSIIGDDNATYMFDINPDTGVIITSASLMDDPTELYRIRVLARDGGTPAKFTDVVVSVRVQKNTHAPVWISSNSTVRLLETLPLGVAFFNISAQDDDIVAPNNKVSYSIVGASDYFQVDPALGSVSLRQPLTSDRSGAALYQIRCMAQDGGSPPLSSEPLMLSVQVVRNKNPPVFDNSVYNISLNENQRVNQVVVSATAVDKDPQNEFGMVSYELVGDDNAGDYFSINPLTGDISLSNSLSTDSATMYQLRIRASDNGSPSKQSTALVRVAVNRNLYRPVFSSAVYNITIPYTQALGETIGAVAATDLDKYAPFNTVSYQLTGDATALKYFIIDQTTGAVQLRKPLGSDASEEYLLVVQAQDGGSPPLRSENTSIVRVKVDLSQHAPRFLSEKYSLNVSKAVVVGTVLINVTAAAEDLNSKLQYEVIGDYPAVEFFDIRLDSGEVYVKRDLREDNALLSAYLLRVKAYDTAAPGAYATAAVSILVNRSGDVPEFSAPNIVKTVSEDLEIGSTVVQVNATSSDNNVDRIYYSMSGDANADQYFFVQPDTGAIILKNSLASDSAASYNLTVLARYVRGSESSRAQIQILVQRDKAEISFTKDVYSVNIAEHLSVNSSVILVTATSTQLKGTMMYTINGFYPARDFFTVRPVALDGAIYLLRDLTTDSSLSTIYTIQVKAYDSASPSSMASANITVRVVRNPNPPAIYPATYYTSIVDDFPVGEEIIRVNATDLDGDTLRYSINSTSAMLDQFFIYPDTGSIVLKKSLISSGLSSFRFQVLASDDRGQFTRVAEAVIIINITHTPSSLPVFEPSAPYRLSVSENLEVNATVLTVRASTANPQSIIRYELVGETYSMQYLRIEPTTGVISIKSQLNNDTATSYFLVLNAWDTSNPDAKISSTVTIDVIRNEYRPVFNSTEYTAVISDYDPVGSVIARVQATDRDVAGPKSAVMYTLEGSRAGAGNFLIHPTSGVVTVYRMLALDESRATAYQLLVIAEDQGSPRQTGSATLVVNVTRNSFAPVFSSAAYNLSVPDTVLCGTAVLSVQASDSDPPGPNSAITYSILNASDISYFSINSLTGSIALSKSLAAAAGKEFHLTVQAADAAILPKVATASVTLTVTRSSQNPDQPVFSPAQYNTELLYTAAVGMRIITVKATTKTCPVMYSILGDGLSVDLFSTDSSSGEITLAKPLTSDTSLAYTIRIQAASSCNAQLTSTALVRVTVVRNQYPPRFNSSSLVISLSQTLPVGSAIESVFASDDDVDSTVLYSISPTGSAPSDVDQMFFINPVTGTLFLTQSLEFTNTSIYKLLIMATDTGIPSRSSSMTLTLNVIRDRPTFTQRLYNVTLDETTPPLSAVTTLTATSNGPVVYSIDFGNSPGAEYFRIDPTTGRLTLQTSLADTCQAVYVMRVTAEDARGSSATADLIISVLRNVHPPVYDTSDYNVTTGEYKTLGEALLTVKATDLDSSSFRSGQIVYTFDSEAEYFSINPTSGRITLISPLYLAAQPKPTSYSMTVVASDMGTPSKSDACRVFIQVLRNQFPPVFEHTTYSASVNSSTTYEGSIVQVAASDEDYKLQPNTPNSNVQYRLDSRDSAATYFTVDGSTGVISLLKPLPYGQGNLYSITFTVTASDSGIPQLSSKVNVTITVQPVLGSSCSESAHIGFRLLNHFMDVIQVSEAAPINSTLSRLPVVNIEPGRSVTCELADKFSTDLPFAVNYYNSECVVYTRRTLSYDVQKRYDLNVGVRYLNASDIGMIPEGSTTALLTVLLEKSNTKPPLFIYHRHPQQLSIAHMYIGAVAQQAPALTFVLQVLAIDTNDPTSTATPQISYVLDSDREEVFLIDRDDGMISTSSAYTQSAQPHYNVTVYGSSTGRSNLSSSAPVTIFSILPEHRMSLNFPLSSVDDVQKAEQNITRTLEEEVGRVVVIERIEALESQAEQAAPFVKRSADTAGARVVFVMVNTDLWTLELNSASQNPLTNAATRNRTTTALQTLSLGPAWITPYNVSERELLGWLADRGYGVYGEGPWIALICMGAIIIFFTVAGIIVMCVTYTRYKRYLRENRHNLYVTNLSEPTTLEAPGYLKQFETQSLAMYVPPDEPLQETRVIKMNFTRQAQQQQQQQKLEREQQLSKQRELQYQEQQEQKRQQIIKQQQLRARAQQQQQLKQQQMKEQQLKAQQLKQEQQKQQQLKQQQMKEQQLKAQQIREQELKQKQIKVQQQQIQQEQQRQQQLKAQNQIKAPQKIQQKQQLQAPIPVPRHPTKQPSPRNDRAPLQSNRPSPQRVMSSQRGQPGVAVAMAYGGVENGRSAGRGHHTRSRSLEARGQSGIIGHQQDGYMSDSSLEVNVNPAYQSYRSIEHSPSRRRAVEGGSAVNVSRRTGTTGSTINKSKTSILDKSTVL